MRILLGFVLVACSSRSTPAPTPVPSVAHDAAPPADAAVPADAVQQAATGSTQPRRITAVSRTCSVDADCTITSDELVDAPPRTYACCGGCTQVAVSVASLRAFHASCEKSPPPMCPPIGCAQPIVHAVCKAGRCAVKAG